MRIVIFGNSGSGKSTLAKRYAAISGVIHLDLDTVAWKENQIGVRESIEESESRIDLFVAENENWVIEGCYSSLLPIALKHASEIVFLNPGMDACLENCRSRPWESHKYQSKDEQDRNLEMLLDWVSTYQSRKDEFSWSDHKRLFDSFEGKKLEILSNTETREKGRNVENGNRARLPFSTFLPFSRVSVFDKISSFFPSKESNNRL